MKQKKNRIFIKKSKSNLKELKEIWDLEKEAYKTKEIGAGTQKFVFKCLTSPELFNLNEGRLTTHDEKRRNEFIEERAKKNKRADVIIFIDSDIVIPVEVEKYMHLKDGEIQLFNYQLIWEKHYGILTDGYTWRFYNNNEFREFNLEEILESTEKFLTFWKEYIKPENYYLSFFENKNEKSLLKRKEHLHVEKYREIFFEDITNLIKGFKTKLELDGYFKNIKDKKACERKALEITYAYLIQFILYKTLADNEFDDFKNKFDDKVNSIHERLKSNDFGKILAIINGISKEISKDIYRPFKIEQNYINEKLENLLFKPYNKLSEVSPWLDIFIFIKKYDFADIKNEIFGFIYENYLKEIYEDKNLGQYYTDPDIVNFMLDQIGYTRDKILKRHNNKASGKSLSIIDPACGSGTFLYSAVDRIVKSLPKESEENSEYIEKLVNNHVFGLDISEFPLYLAEMSILMRMLHIIVKKKYNSPVKKKIKLFETEDSIAEFIGDDLGSGIPESFMRDKDDINELKASIKKNNDIPRRRFDFVIGNPPYISYNACCGSDLKFFKLQKEKENISLNNVYGWNLHSTPTNKKKYPPKPNLYAFFMALGFELLKEEGHFCYIIPQTMITESDYDVIRYQLSKKYTIEKIFTFAGNLFISRGLKQQKKIATSSMILVCKKEKPHSNHVVNCYHFKDKNLGLADISKSFYSKNWTIHNKINQKKLLSNLENWNFITWDKAFTDFYNKYKQNTEGMDIYYDHRKAAKVFGERFYFDVGYILENKLITNKKTSAKDYIAVAQFKDFCNFSSFKPTSFYPFDKSKIILPKNSQGYKALAPKYKILWEKSRSNKFYFTDKEILPSMSYCQFISTNSKGEALFLFSILNSKITWEIYKKLFSIHEQKHGIFLVIKRIKEFIRLPYIDKDKNALKNRIIHLTAKMIEMEKKTINDLIDLDTLIQRFDAIDIVKNKLILTKEKNVIKVNINHGNEELIKKIIHTYYGNKKDKPIYLAELKSLPVLDYEKQMQLKDQIDELIYDLYELSEKERNFIEAKDAESEFLKFKAKFQKIKTNSEKESYSKSLSPRTRKLLWLGLREYRKSYSFVKEDELIKEITELVRP